MMRKIACLAIAGVSFASLAAPTPAQSQAAADTPKFTYSQLRRTDTRSKATKSIKLPPHAFTVNFDGRTLSVFSSFDPSETNKDTSGGIGFDSGSLHFTCSRDESVSFLIGHNDLRKFLLRSLSGQSGTPLDLGMSPLSGVNYSARWELATGGRERVVESSVSLVGIEARISFEGENLIALLSDFYRSQLFVHLRLTKLNNQTFDPKPTITFMLSTEHLSSANNSKVPLAQALNFCETTVSLQQRTKRSE